MNSWNLSIDILTFESSCEIWWRTICGFTFKAIMTSVTLVTLFTSLSLYTRFTYLHNNNNDFGNILAIHKSSMLRVCHYLFDWSLSVPAFHRNPFVQAIHPIQEILVYLDHLLVQWDLQIDSFVGLNNSLWKEEKGIEKHTKIVCAQTCEWFI